MNSIIGFTGIIEDGLAGPINEEQKTQLKITTDSANHLLQLINNVLDLSRIEAGKSEVVFKHFQIPDLLYEVHEQIFVLFKEKEIALNIDFDACKIKVISDGEKLYQILINLLNNALKFTEEGSVEVTCQAAYGELIISVKDNGIGIDNEHLDIIFHSFQQSNTGDNRTYQETGQGLAISQKFSTMING